MKVVYISILTFFCIRSLEAAAQSPPAKIFDSPQQAVTALAEAVNMTNRAAFATLFGSEAERLVNPDSIQGARELADFAAAFNTTNRLLPDSDMRMILQVGNNAWPFPIPIVRTASGWFFDTAAGTDEILNRRIGRNELDILRVIRAYVEAQGEYASRDRDSDDGVLEFAQKIASSPGRMDGLFWPPELSGEISPLGPLIAYAQSEGYFRDPSASDNTPQPFHGYLFKILVRQGKNAPGGGYDYIINGNMIGGFALIAWPAQYRDSGVMTFIVNHQGRVYQKDMGPDTAKTVRKLTAYNPDGSWRPSSD